MKSRLIAFCLPLIGIASAWSAVDSGPKRVPWTTSRIHGSPDPPKPFVARRIQPKLEFKEALEIVFEPGSKRWFALEKNGRILSWPHDGDADHVDLVADIKALHPDLDYLYGLAFHPKFADNHQVFITYTRGAGIDDGTKLSRFFMHDGKLDPASEQVILTWRSGGHNGANLQFGPDGMLYISAGDSEIPSPPDPLNTGQDISDLLSSILRIDVDHRDPGLAYAIPKDNPFVGQTVESVQRQPKPARGEIWAYGLRNPWKMSFDQATSRLWCGDVGWELWEMIHLIERGGNYGWSAMEASQPVRADAPRPPTAIRPPIVAHSHDEAASITGGYVYHGKKFPELEGAYIYGDWGTGKIWALWHDGKQVTRHEEIVDTHHKIIAFGQDAEGELLYLDYSEKGALYELVRNKAEKTEKFPVKLSETGLLSRTPSGLGEPSPGVYRFSINAPMWADHAIEGILVGLPGESALSTNIKRKKSKGGQEQVIYELVWPKDSVLAKTLSADVKERGASIPFETQVLHFDGQTWNGYSYRWNRTGDDAELVPASGDERGFVDASGHRRTWRFHSRAECMRCHNSWVGFSLAFKPEQLRGIPSMYSVGKEQMNVFSSWGLIDEAFTEQSTGWHLQRPGSDGSDAGARSYLHTNCSHCHRQNAGGAVNMFLNADLALEDTQTVNAVPAQGGLGLANPKLIDPGNPWNSVIALRIAKPGTGHMPIIGPHEVDVEGLKLIEDWIARMGNQATNAADLLPKEWNEPLLKDKLATVEGAMQVLRAVDDGLIKEPLRQKALDLAWNSSQATVRDLFDRFLPDNRRVETLGLNPDPKKILALQGDTAHGSHLLSPQGKLAACFACHLINGTGRDFGPDLSKVATRLKPDQILESVLRPSKVIAQGYQAVSVETNDGALQVGFVVKDSAGELAVKTATGQTVTVQKSNIARQTNLTASLMPEGLVQSLTAQEAADLLTFLTSLR